MQEDNGHAYVYRVVVYRVFSVRSFAHIMYLVTIYSAVQVLVVPCLVG